MSERLIHANDVELCIETFGDPADPAVLLIHGAQASMLWWEEDLCTAIAAAGRHVIRFDNRDTGRSVSYPPGEPPYAMSDLAADAVGILDTLGIDQAHVVGRSMSGGTALFLGVDYPERVLSLTLVNTTTGDDDLPDIDDAFIGSAPMPASTDTAALEDYVVSEIRNFAGRSPYFDESAVRARARRDIARTHSIMSTLTNHWQMTFDAPRRGGWADLRVPSLIVQGELDPFFPPPHGEALAAAIPEAELLLLKDTGHDVPPPVWDVFVPALLAHTAARRAS